MTTMMNYLQRIAFLSILLRAVAALERFQVASSQNAMTKFTCSDSTARCIIQTGDFSKVDLSEGNVSRNTYVTTWSSMDANSILTVGSCKNDSGCIVSCSDSCSCTYTMGGGSEQSCVKVNDNNAIVDPAAEEETPASDDSPRGTTPDTAAVEGPPESAAKNVKSLGIFFLLPIIQFIFMQET